MFTIMADKLTKFKEDMEEARSKVMYMIRIFELEVLENYESFFQYRKFEY